FYRPDLFDSHRLARGKHILWIFENVPQSAVASEPYLWVPEEDDKEVYDKATQIWLRHVEGNLDNVAILANAACFFYNRDFQMTHMLYRRCQALEPANPKWSKELGRLYSLAQRDCWGKTRQRAAKCSLQAYERALASSVQPLARFRLLRDVAEAALDAEEF